MAGKSWQTSHELSGPRGRQAPVTLINSGKRNEGGKGGGKTEASWSQKPPRTCERMEFWRMRLRDTTGHGATLALFEQLLTLLHLTTLNLSISQ